MEEVNPIRSKEVIEKIKERLKNNPRNLLLFVLGINTGLRISDILKLKKIDVKKNYVRIREKKTKKFKQFPLNKAVMEILPEYIKDLEDDDYLFTGQGRYTPLSRLQAYKILKTASLGLCSHIGTHSLRKTFGYHHYKLFNDIVLLQKILNHSSPSVTLRYIGLLQENINNSYMALNL